MLLLSFVTTVVAIAVIRHCCYYQDFPLLKKMRFLNLCSGTGSVSRPFVENGWEVIEVDISGRHAPTHVVDLNEWDCPYETGFFDAIWASPDCTQYSRARTTAKEPRNLEKADRLVKRCLELISHLQPRVWFLEHPDSNA